MKRRDFLAASAVFTLLASANANAAKKTAPKKPLPKKTTTTVSKPSPKPEPRNAISLPDEPLAQWQSYSIHSTIELNNTNGKVRLWMPLAQYKDTLWQRSLGHNWQGNFETAGIYRDPVAEMEVFYADWPEGTSHLKLQMTSQVATQNRHFDITRRGAMAERTEVLRRCLQSTELAPNDGIVRSTAERVIGRIKDPVAQGKAIYEWVVENTSYDPSLKSIGNIYAGQLPENGSFVGRSADIALLFVALCRSIGIPARPVFGLRIDSSRLFSSLGTNGNLSEAQQCRAEFYTPGYGWIPVNPSDVRKAIRDENLGLDDSKLSVLKKLLFGFWEMNWISFNAAQDVSLRGSTGKTIPFLAYPHVEIDGARFNSRDTARFNYRITASRIDGYV